MKPADELIEDLLERIPVLKETLDVLTVEERSELETWVQPLVEGGTSVLHELRAEQWDEKRIEELLHQARALGAKSESRRRSREDRLRSLGYDESSDAQRKKLLNQNMAMRDWPKR